jgi:Ykl077w/Psg1 (Pma1 Stabilization in Golgi)
MKGLSSNNITLYINPVAPIAGEPASFQGPTVEVTNPVPDIYHPEKTPVPTGESLYIALPTVFGFVLICVCGGFIWNRKHRQIGLGNVMGRRKGYGVGKSRSQRLGLGKKKAGAIQLREQELTAGGQYRDAPVEREDTNRTTGHARADSDALGSLAGTPTEERTNYFRDEMRR